MRHARRVKERQKSAGGSSQSKYYSLTRSWRRRNRKLLWTVAVVCAAVVLTSFVAAQHWPNLAWPLGLLGGAALAFAVIARLSPPGWIENWQSGAWGEQATAKALRPLEDAGWIVLHDLPVGAGNIDHIAVGPGGVYLLDSKRLGGAVSVGGEGVIVRRLDDPDLSYHHTGSKHVLSLARQTHHRVLAGTRLKTWVTPVMVLWAEFPQRVSEREGCVYVHGEDLVRWLQSQPRRIAPNRVRQVADAVAASWGSRTAAP